VIERTTVEHYRLSGMELIEDYDVEYAEEEVSLPAVDFGDEITPDGYDTPTWVPVMFAWAGQTVHRDKAAPVIPGSGGRFSRAGGPGLRNRNRRERVARRD
jgi:hypothetical protein